MAVRMIIPGGILVVGFITVVVASEWYGLRFGGVVVVPLLALYMLFDYKALPLFAASTAVAFLTLIAVERRYVLFGRTTLLVAMAAGAVVPTFAALVSQVVLEQAVPLRNVAYLGSILPGLAAFNLYRLEGEERLADVIGSLSLVAGLLMLGAFFFLTRSLVVDSITLAQVVETTTDLLLAGESPIVTPPSPILPRVYIVGLFVAGILVNEFVQRRYGLRLAGVIAIPLVAIFTLYNVLLLWTFVAVTAACAVFIRFIHRSTFLYGRNLLASCCIVGVLLAGIAIPFLPPDAAIRTLMVGILSGVAAYNGHVLAPTERVDSIIASVAMFCGMFVSANAIASYLGEPVAEPLRTPQLVVCGVLLLLGAIVLAQYEGLRPDRTIRQIDPAETIVPDGGSSGEANLLTDGGTSEETENGGIVADGGSGNPLAGRRVGRFGPNAEVVYRGEER